MDVITVNSQLPVGDLSKLWAERLSVSSPEFQFYRGSYWELNQT